MKTFSALLASCAGNSPVSGEFPTQRPVTRSFGVFFDLHPNMRLSKQWWGWWLRRYRVHYDVIVMICMHLFRGDHWPTCMYPLCSHDNAWLWTTFEQPTCSTTFCVTVLNTIKILCQPWCPLRCFNNLCTTFERPRQSFGILWALKGDLASRGSMVLFKYEQLIII